jgi:transcriptional regulator with GAF, ATPase, and Fis domain
VRVKKQRSAREILEDIDLAIRRFQAQAAPAEAQGGGVASFRAAIAPLRRELDSALADLEARALLGHLSLELGRLFAAQSGPRDFCGAALAAIRDVMRASTSRVLVFDEDGARATVLAEIREDGAPADAEAGLSRSMLAQVIEKREPILVEDAMETPHGDATSISRMKLRSILIAPLILDSKVGGAIYLENSKLAGAFTETDRKMLQSIAGLLAPFVQVGSHLDAALAERDELHAALEGESRYHGIVGRSAPTRKLAATIERLKGSDVPVLVTGESGTGKELVARALHASSRRASGPLVVVNCAAIPEGLMESELLGHERGAFTGATDKRTGKFEQAHRGTLFLDEIGELRLDLQAKLLRVIQEQAFERVGGTETLRVDVRIVAATNRDLARRVAEGHFREDLFYRLNVVPLAVAPLRDRPEDILPLAEHFLTELSRAAGKSLRFGPGVVAALQRHSFPGNVRELRNCVHRMVALAASDVLTEDDLPPEVGGPRSVGLDKDPLRRFLKQEARTQDELKGLRTQMQDVLDGYLRQVEARFLRAALDRAGGNVSEAARAVGMNRTALHRKLRELETEIQDGGA